MPTSEELRIIIEAQNQASPQIRQVTEDLKNLQRDISDATRAARNLSYLDLIPPSWRGTIGQLALTFQELSRSGQQTRTVLDEMRAAGFNVSEELLRLNPQLLEEVDAGQKATASLAGLTLGKLALAAAAVGLTVELGKTVVELGNYGQIVERTSQKFVAFSGGAEMAARNLAAVQKAADYGISSMDAMQYSSMLLSMGLADTGEKAGQIIRLALMLGPVWRDASTNVQDFTMLLANQSVRRLDQFGLSISAVKERQKELMATGLASDLAFTNAVLEIGTQRMHELERAGMGATTSAQKLTAAWADLRAELSKQFAESVGTMESGLAAMLREFTVSLRAGARSPTEIIASTAVRKTFEAFGADGEAFSGLRQLPDTLQRSADAADDLAASLQDVQNVLTGIDRARMSELLAKEIKSQENALTRLQSQLLDYESLVQALQQAEAAGDKARAARLRESLLKIDIDKVLADIATIENSLQALMMRKRTIDVDLILHPPVETYQEFMDTYMQHMMLTGAQPQPLQPTWRPLPLDSWRMFLNAPNPPGTYGAWYNEPPTEAEQETVLRSVESTSDQAAKAAQRAFEDAARATQSAFERVAGSIESKLSEGMQWSTRLSDLRPGGERGLLGPGVGGPFEDIYRLQAWIKDNSWGEIAAKYGITSKEEAAARVRKFQLGIFDESVTALFDTEKLKEIIVSEQQAEASRKAFAEKLAKAVGVSTDVVKAAVWGADYTNPAGQTQKMADIGQSMGGMLVTGINRAQPDLWQAGYNAAMAMMAGWKDALGGKENPPTGGNTGGPPPAGTPPRRGGEATSDYIRTGRSYGIQ